MTEQLKYVMTGSTVSVILGEDSMTISDTHPNFEEVCEGLFYETLTDYEEIASLMNTKKAIKKWSKGGLVIKKGLVHYKNLPVANNFVSKILSLMSNGEKEFKRFAKFLEKTLQNPSLQTQQRLMEFASAGNIEISKQGDVIAFKNTDSNGLSKHAGSFDEDGNYLPNVHYFHDIGEVCSMPRDKVNDNDEETCSQGLHVCSFRYLATAWGTSGKNFRVLVDPKDFVSVPTDYKNSKARVCKYTVKEVLTNDELEDLASEFNDGCDFY